MKIDWYSIYRRILRVKVIWCETCGKYRAIQVHHKDKKKIKVGIKDFKLLCKYCHKKEKYKLKSKLGYGDRHIKKSLR